MYAMAGQDAKEEISLQRSRLISQAEWAAQRAAFDHIVRLQRSRLISQAECCRTL